MTDENKQNNTEDEKEEAISFFQLEAVTLRGIGSYFHEARLEIKPLTILCGQNGSGKSTWFKILKYLRLSSKDILFPLFSLPDYMPTVSESPTLLNTLVMAAADNSCMNDDEKPVIDAIISRHNPEEDYGPLGTIGLEITTLHDCRINLVTQKRSRPYKISFNRSEDKNLRELYDFLGNGVVKKGAKFILRFSLKSGFFDDKNCDPDDIIQVDFYKEDLLVFRIVENHLITHKIFGDIWMSIKGRQKGEYYILPCGLKQLRDHLTKNWCSGQDFRDIVSTAFINKQSNKYRLSLHCLDMFRSLISSTLNGIFILSANRPLLNDKNEYWWKYGEIDNFEDIIRSRYVGELGENSIKIERAYAKTPMIQMGTFKKQDGDKILNNKLKEHKGSLSDKEKLLLRQYILEKKDIFDKKNINSKSLKNTMKVFVSIEINNILPRYCDGAVVYFTPLFIRYWLCRLGICSFYYFNERNGFADFIQPPSGFHFYATPNKFDPYDDPVDGDEGIGIACDISRYRQDPLRFLSSVESLSSGFHHIFPILAQSAVMWPQEIFCVDSPEIHLHPSSVLKITEFFITHAKTGRRFILETHSDLVVRRTLRAILEEELSQHQVNIYFTKLERIDSHPALQGLKQKTDQIGSLLELIQVNQKGQIVNWPEGFLDADVIEARRLIDAMYGAAERNEEKNEEDEQPNE